MTGMAPALVAAWVTPWTAWMSPGWPAAQMAAGVWATVRSSAAWAGWPVARSWAAAASSGFPGSVYSRLAGPGPQLTAPSASAAARTGARTGAARRPARARRDGHRGGRVTAPAPSGPRMGFRWH